MLLKVVYCAALLALCRGQNTYSLYDAQGKPCANFTLDATLRVPYKSTQYYSDDSATITLPSVSSLYGPSYSVSLAGSQCPTQADANSPFTTILKISFSQQVFRIKCSTFNLFDTTPAYPDPRIQPQPWRVDEITFEFNIDDSRFFTDQSELGDYTVNLTASSVNINSYNGGPYVCSRTQYKGAYIKYADDVVRYVSLQYSYLNLSPFDSTSTKTVCSRSSGGGGGGSGGDGSTSDDTSTNYIWIYILIGALIFLCCCCCGAGTQKKTSSGQTYTAYVYEVTLKRVYTVQQT